MPNNEQQERTKSTVLLIKVFYVYICKDNYFSLKFNYIRLGQIKENYLWDTFVRGKMLQNHNFIIQLLTISKLKTCEIKIFMDL